MISFKSISLFFEMVLIGDLLTELIDQSEKAAKIARLIRDNDELFNLLIEEKDEKSKNHRFDVDFKTLADVLIQQTIKFHVNKKVKNYFLLTSYH